MPIPPPLDGQVDVVSPAAPTVSIVPVGSAAASLGSRFALLATTVRRLQTASVPVEPVPVSWSSAAARSTSAMVAVMAPAAHSASPQPASATIAEDVAVGPNDPVSAPLGVPGRVARPVSGGGVKGGPPRARRRRADTGSAQGPVALPEMVVPVMAAEAVAPDAPPEMVVPVMAAEAVAPDAPPDDALTELDTRALPGRAAVLIAAAAAADKPRVIDPGQDPAVERARSTLAQRIGDDAERLAAIRLETLGWRIVARNLRLSRAEIDLLAIDPADPPTLVIVEVRRRNRRDFGLAEETVDHRKRAALRRAAGELAMRPVLPDGRRLPALPVRVDLIAIDRGPEGRPSLRHHRGIET